MALRRLSITEEELMNTFWKIGTPATSVDILAYAKNKTWSGNYIHKMLKVLEEKKFIEMNGAAQYNGRLVRQFTPLVSKEEYTTFLLEQQGLTAKSFAKIALAFVKKDKENRKRNENSSLKDSEAEIDEEFINELQEMVDSLKNKEDK